MSHNPRTVVLDKPDSTHQLLDLSALSPQEQELLQLWNQTQADYPQCGIHNLIESQVARTPNRIAFIFENNTITYSELNERANQLARHLQTLGAAPDVLIGIHMQRSLDMVVGLIAILKSGAGYIPLDPSFPQERLAYMVEDAKMPIILTESRQLDTVPSEQATVVCLDLDWNAIAQYSKENPTSAVKPENIAYTIYTSGSTGNPKGVQISHQAAVNLLVSMSKTPGMSEDDMLLAVTTISFDIAVVEMFLPLMLGAKVTLVSREVAADAARLMEALERSQASVMQATPATWRMLLAGGWQGNSTLKILCGGEPMPRSLADRLLARSGSVWNVYGPTETTVYSTAYRVEPGEKPIFVGRPIANTQLYIVDAHLRRQSDPLKPVPIGEAGELLIGGDGLARGYLNREDLTSQKFIPDPFSQKPGARLYRTGDLARFLPDGNVELIGRIDNQVKIRGFRIELGDIEAALSLHSSIREVAVVARDDNSGEKRLIAYVVADLYADRVPYQCDCFIESDGYAPIQSQTVDLSLNGFCLRDVPEDWQVGRQMRLRLQLPGARQELILDGTLTWHSQQYTGIAIAATSAQQAILRQSIKQIAQTDEIVMCDLRRRDPRVTFQKTCSVELWTGQEVEMTTQNISAGGVRLVASEPDIWEIGQTIRLRLQLPGVRDEVTLSGAIMWHYGRDAGIMFDVMSSQQPQLHQGVDRITATQGLSLSQLRSFLKNKLPEYMIPSTFVVMDSLPLTPSGKVDRRALPEPNQGRAFLEEEFVAPSNPVEKQLAAIWTQVLGIDRIGIHDNFFELGGHSLLTAQLLSQVRDGFGVELSLTSLFQSPTIAGLAEIINSDNTAQSDAAIVAQLKSDAFLDNSIRPTVPVGEFCANPQHIFLTGVTGFLGAFLLHELLEQTQATIHCLVRAATLENGKQKIAANLKNYSLENDSIEHRVVPVLGDLAQPKFGLSDREFDELAAKIDWIYHNGAFVNLIYPYAPLRAANVLGTKEILKLASQVKIKPVHFISTLDVFQSPRYMDMERILETDELATPEGLDDGYSQTKWVGEKLVMEANARGIPACIYRPASISGHSQSGASQTNDTICRLIKGLIQMGSAPDMNVQLSLTPVDYVSRAIVHLSKQPESFGKAFHFATPHGLPWQQLVNEIKNYGYSIDVTSYQQWQEQLFEVTSSQPDNALGPLLFLFAQWRATSDHSYLETTAFVNRPFDCHNTVSGLAETAIACPVVDTNVFSAYFAYFIKNGFLMNPPTSH